MQTLAYSDFVLKDVNEPHSDINKALLAFDKMQETLPPLDRQGPWMVGGTVRRLLAGEEFTTDVDIMFKNMNQFEDYCAWMREHGAETISESERQITFKYKGLEVQPIRAVFHNTLIQTLQDFDFTICQFGYDGSNLVWGDHSMEHLKEKKLVFTHTNDHISTMRRAFKYAEQGFFMDHDAIARFLKDAIKQATKVEETDKKWEAEAKASGGFRSGWSGRGSYA